MDLQVIEREGQRVLTTAQVATAYEIESKSLMRNFQRNKEHFAEGLHFMALTGDVLKQFKGERQNDVSLKYASVLYLWTEQGAFLLAKSLNSEKAWQAYNLLTNQYFKLVNDVAKSVESPQNLLPYFEERLITLENRMDQISKNITLHTGEQKRVQKAVSERVYTLSKKSVERTQLFRELYSSLKLRYEVSSYRDIKQYQLQDALRFIYAWNGGVAK